MKCRRSGTEDMAAWSVVVLGLVGLLALEVLVFRYLNGDLDLGRSSRAGNEAAASGTRADGTRRAGPGGSAADRGTSTRCQHCGAANATDQSFEFCRDCLGRIQ